jgi:hypothetical protein
MKEGKRRNVQKISMGQIWGWYLSIIDYEDQNASTRPLITIEEAVKCSLSACPTGKRNGKHLDRFILSGLISTMFISF